jgi:hypothetical protein
MEDSRAIRCARSDCRREIRGIRALRRLIDASGAKKKTAAADAELVRADTHYDALLYLPNKKYPSRLVSPRPRAKPGRVRVQAGRAHHDGGPDHRRSRRRRRRGVRSFFCLPPRSRRGRRRNLSARRKSLGLRVRLLLRGGRAALRLRLRGGAARLRLSTGARLLFLSLRLRLAPLLRLRARARASRSAASRRFATSRVFAATRYSSAGLRASPRVWPGSGSPKDVPVPVPVPVPAFGSPAESARRDASNVALRAAPSSLASTRRRLDCNSRTNARTKSARDSAHACARERAGASASADAFSSPFASRAGRFRFRFRFRPAYYAFRRLL